MALLDAVVMLLIGALGAITQILCNKGWHHCRVGESAFWLAILYVLVIRPGIVRLATRLRRKRTPNPDPDLDPDLPLRLQQSR